MFLDWVLTCDVVLLDTKVSKISACDAHERLSFLPDLAAKWRTSFSAPRNNIILESTKDPMAAEYGGQQVSQEGYYHLPNRAKVYKSFTTHDVHGSGGLGSMANGEKFYQIRAGMEGCFATLMPRPRKSLVRSKPYRWSCEIWPATN